jgi:membrane protease YdiL (CAAX protease family)
MYQLRNANPALRTLLLISGFALAVGLRVLLGGPGAAQSPWAGLVFATCLIAMGIAAGVRTHMSRRIALIGLAGGAALCVPALIALKFQQPPHYPVRAYWVWAIVVAIVATAEELFLRGALFDAAKRWLGDVAAIVMPAVAFAALHVPLYGWHVVPLDLAVGVWLGALRQISGTWTAPAIAHTLADLLAWWL